MRFISQTIIKIILATLTAVFLLAIPVTRNEDHWSEIALSYSYAADCPSGSHSEQFDQNHVLSTRCVNNTTGAQVGDSSVGGNSSASWSDWVNFIISGAFLIYLSGMLLYFAGYLLNGSIQIFVIDMGSQLSKGTTLGDAIITSWGLIRDIINLTFVFGMIYLAFMTIVKADTSKLKHGVISILVAALLINFSLFFGKAVIDFGNVAALEIYTYMESKAESPKGDQLNYGISGFFVDRMGLGKFFKADDLIAAGDNPTLAFDNKTGFGFAILVSIVLLIASFVFFAGAILIAIRFISLALLLVLSPVAFAKAALPGINTEEWSRKWWSSLVSQVIFLPAYFLMLYISMTAIGETQKGSDMTTFFKGVGGIDSVKIILNFVIIIGFLIGSLIIAKKMGAYGASTVNTWGTSIAKGTSSFIGRNTVGKLAHEDLKNYDRLVAKSPTWVRKGLYATGLHSATRGALNKMSNAKFGGSQSYTSAEHDREEFTKEIAATGKKESLVAAIKAGTAAGASPVAKIAMERALGGATVKELEDLGHDTLHKDAVVGALTHAQVEGLMKSDHLDADFKSEFAVARSGEIKRRLTDGTPNGLLSEGISKASSQQLKALGAKMLIDDPALAGALGTSQMDDLKKELTETEFGLLKTARDGELQRQFAADPTVFFTNRKEKDIAKLSKGILTDVNAAPHLTGEVLRRILEDNDLSATDREMIVDHITTPGVASQASARAFLNSPRGANFA